MLGPDGRPPFTGQRTFAADRTRLDQAILAENSALDAPGAMAEVVTTIGRARERDPYPFLFFHEAAADIRAGDLAGALELNERGGALQPPSAEEAVQRAFILQQLGRMPEAESLLLQTARNDPYYFQTYSLLAKGWEQTHQVEAAKAYFEALAERMPGSRNAQIPYAGLLASTGDWKGAEDQWRSVLRSVPDEEAALQPLVDRLQTQHKDDEALELMLKAYAYNPRSFSNNLRLVQFFEDRRDLENLVKYLIAVSQSGPVRPQLYVDLASEFFLLGRRDEAVVALVKARRGADMAGDSELLKTIDDLARKNGLQ
jgi:tetratricopeptide (TPR) repeat protein